MPVQSIPIGPVIPILQNVVYALPAKSVSVESGAILQSSILPTGPWNNLVSLNQLVSGCFTRCATGNTSVRIRG